MRDVDDLPHVDRRDPDSTARILSGLTTHDITVFQGGIERDDLLRAARFCPAQRGFLADLCRLVPVIAVALAASWLPQLAALLLGVGLSAAWTWSSSTTRSCLRCLLARRLASVAPGSLPRVGMWIHFQGLESSELPVNPAGFEALFDVEFDELRRRVRAGDAVWLESGFFQLNELYLLQSQLGGDRELPVFGGRHTLDLPRSWRGP